MSIQKIPFVRVAFWGASSAGKTSLMARYYGLLKEELDKDPYFDLVPNNDNAKVLVDYYDLMTKERKFPLGTTALQYRSFNFSYCHEKTTDPAINIEWIDYPGGWWQIKGGTLSDSERKKRDECLSKLLNSEVIFLLLDAKKFQNSPEYFSEQLKSFAEQIDELKRSERLGKTETKLDEFVIALTKADLVIKKDPSFNAQKFRNELEKTASKELQELWNVINPTGKRRYALLSAAVADPEDPKAVKVHSLNYIGLDAIAPVAFDAATERAEHVHQAALHATPDGSTQERAGEGGIAIGGIAGVGAGLLGIGASAIGLPLAIAAGIAIFALGLGSSLKVSGAKKREKHQSVNEKRQNVVELAKRLEAARLALLSRYYYYEE